MEYIVIIALVIGLFIWLIKYCWWIIIVIAGGIVVVLLDKNIFKQSSFKNKKGVQKNNVLFPRKKISYVKENSKACQQLDLINKKYNFLQIKSFEYTKECSTLYEYHKLYASDEAKKEFEFNYNEILKEFNKAVENSKQWQKYLIEYSKAEKYMTSEEIRSLPKRKMSVKSFSRLEKQIFENEKLKAPIIKISLTCTITYSSPYGRNFYTNSHTLSHYDIETIIKMKEKEEKERLEKEALRLLYEKKERERREKEEKERLEKEKKRKQIIMLVKEKSKAYQNIIALNKRYVFFDLKVLSFTIKCSSYSEYSKFSAKNKFKEQFLQDSNLFQEFFTKIENNKKLFEKYNREYIMLYPIKTSCEFIANDMDEFYRIEKELCKKSLKIPYMDKKICYIIKYVSPQGRNRYRKEEYLEEDDIEQAFFELEKEKEVRKQKLIEKQEKDKEQAEIRALLKNKGKLERKEAELAKREQEFQRATQGHIYAASDSPTPVEAEQPKIETAEELLSAWEKMKRLKKTYENGEITYEEYNEKRKHLL